MPSVWSLFSAHRLTFGRGAVEQLGPIAARLRVKRAFLVTDANLVKAGVVDRVLKPFHSANITVEVFDGSEAEPSLAMVERCVEAAKAFGPDGFVAVGGGSNMDAAKLTAVVQTHGGSPRDYTGEDRVPGPTLPLICVPTTAGTGSEVSGAAVFTDTDNHIKVSTLSEFVRPAAAVVDPVLTMTCPPKVTADSGIDALTHAIEGFTATRFADLPAMAAKAYSGKNPVSDLFAEQAVRLVAKHLRQAVHHGDDEEARDGMALAATLGGLAFSNAGVALVHALEYPVGAAVHCSHGGGNGLLLPFVMKFNLPERRAEFARIAEWLGEEAAPEKAVAAVDRLRADIGIPGKLRELGVTEDMLPTFAEKAFGLKRLLYLNPRSATQDDLLGIYRDAF